MAQSSSSAATPDAHYCTFVIRLTWDRIADSWSIQLTPINRANTRHFDDLEALLLFLEAVMRETR